VKFIGDAALVVFPAHAVDLGVRALLELRDDVDRAMTERGWECRLSAKAHFGTAIAGDFGPGDSKRFDVVGRAVNTAAKLRSNGITLSAEAFHQLSSELQPSFKEQPAPATYVALEKHD
jgi:class 3 adenylate cyclase